MLPGMEEQQAKRLVALEHLRFNKNRRANNQTASSSSTTLSDASVQPSYPTPPPQSRDATVSSKFFASTPSQGTILVPNSSPLQHEEPPRPYRPYGHVQRHDVAAISTQPFLNGWSQPLAAFTSDTLNAPTGFTSSKATPHASLRRQWNGDDFFGSHIQEEGPPRKRPNLGPSQDALNTTDSPPSPEIRRAGQKRRPVNSSMDISSLSSDDSLPGPGDMLANSSKSRIVRGRPSPSPKPPPADPEAERRFNMFKLSMPGYSPARVEAAWRQAGEDVIKAGALLSDPNWRPTPAASPVTEKEVLGRVKEVDEANKAQRAAVKEKGKKSMIYANRSNLETQVQSSSTPTTSKAVLDLTMSPTSPLTPIVRAPRRKRVKKLVIGSDTEAEFADSDEDDERESKRGRTDATPYEEIRAFEYFNTAEKAALQELTGCTPDQAEAIVELRPFESIDDLNTKLGQGKKKAGPSGLSSKLFEDCKSILKGYGSVDAILEDCERIGAGLRAAIATWTTSGKGKDKADSPENGETDGALSIVSLAKLKQQKTKDYLTSQPSLLPDDVQLKEYQLLGVNWLNLLYRRKLSCILADEMGLGKTIQVISFLASLKEQGNKGPHLIVVPSSTLENWCREFARFAPSISVQTYYAGKEERSMLRQTLTDTQRCNSKTGVGWEVLITTYNLAQGDDRDRKFFRRIDWNCCIYDEGHVLKNFQSQRYQSLLKFGSNWRLLLTGTPLQNNLQELVSLMNFILPEQFAAALVDLRAIFKVKGDSTVSLLSQERISRAKKMMTPFVLRRRKDQVLKDLPNKTERIEWCDMTELQRSIYTDALQRSRKTLLDAPTPTDTGTPEDTSATNGRGKTVKKKSKASARPKDKVYLENSSNVLMDLRKAASHPMLFRRRFTDDVLTGITRQLLKEPDFKKRGALFDLVKEDMSVMTDAELQIFCASYKSTRKYLQDENCYLDAGKVQTLLKLLSAYGREGRKVLIFSQFTQILDILQAVLNNNKIKYLILTGSTPVDVRQTLVDEFTEDETIPVFLLSTKAGGMGINLTAASVVVMFDQDFNPHNDRQAQDRAYRIGQKRDVDVVKLISRGTIEEDMLKLGQTKLALDEAVAGDNGEDKDDGAPEQAMKTSLMNVLRRQFEKQQGDGGNGTAVGGT